MCYQKVAYNMVTKMLKKTERHNLTLAALGRRLGISPLYLNTITITKLIGNTINEA